MDAHQQADSMASSTEDTSSLIDLGWKQLDQQRFAVVTFAASFTLRLLTYPLSLLKTNQQTRRALQLYPPSDSLVETIYSKQGIRGFYKGLTINLIGNSSHVLYATTYETLREFLQSKLQDTPLMHEHTHWIGPVASGISGVCASAVQLCISTPFDMITQKRMILQGDAMHTVRVRHIFHQILSEEGHSIFGLWRGLTLSLMTYAPTSGIVWSSYRYCKPRLYAYLYYDIAVDDLQNRHYVLLNLLAGAVSGGMAGVLTIPLDTIKVRKQVLAKRSTKGAHIVRAIYAEAGIGGFFRGIVPRTCQYTISCAIIMTVYDWVKRVSSTSASLVQVE